MNNKPYPRPALRRYRNFSAIDRYFSCPVSPASFRRAISISSCPSTIFQSELWNSLQISSAIFRMEEKNSPCPVSWRCEIPASISDPCSRAHARSGGSSNGCQEIISGCRYRDNHPQPARPGSIPRNRPPALAGQVAGLAAGCGRRHPAIYRHPNRRRIALFWVCSISPRKYGNSRCSRFFQAVAIENGSLYGN